MDWRIKEWGWMATIQKTLFYTAEEIYYFVLEIKQCEICVRNMRNIVKKETL
jgi:hypothetical protein